MKIITDDLSDPRIAAFLEEHIEDMLSVSPPESKHALDLDGLKQPDITFWSVWEDDLLIGCGALKELDSTHAEIKSMRTSRRKRSRGVGSKIRNHLLSVANSRGYQRLSLETGSMPFFEPARKLYRKFGFVDCAPFADYRLDPNSVFMTIDLSMTYQGQCSCGSVTLRVKLPDAIQAFASRACDCDFCTSRDIEYMSDPNGSVQLYSSEPLTQLRQGSDQAEFLTCAECDTVLCASYISDQNRIGSVNATLLNDYEQLSGSEVVSPKLLGASDKVERWKMLWMPIEIICR